MERISELAIKSKCLDQIALFCPVFQEKGKYIMCLRSGDVSDIIIIYLNLESKNGCI